MHRLQRLHALVDHLRAARSAVTVAELAETFGVTERTMFRDLAALRANEIPIESDPGPGGGIRLSRSYLLPPLGLSLEEAVALWITVQLHGARHHRALTQALDKVIAGIPAERRVTFERVLRRIVIGPEATAEQQQDAVPPDPEIYRTVEQAVLQGLCLQLDYRDRDGRRTQRQVEPHGLLVLDPVWYVLALDKQKEAPRTFRLDRIESVSLGSPFQPMDPRILFPLS
jgi:predicted DNA-binding transcriptional regulator YafY